MPEQLHARVRAQLKLALLGDCGCPKTLTRLEREARSSGLTGAEIDAAIGGRSFEARTAAAVAFACALKAGKADLLDQANRLSNALAALGVQRGDRVAIAQETRATRIARLARGKALLVLKRGQFRPPPAPISSTTPVARGMILRR